MIYKGCNGYIFLFVQVSGVRLNSNMVLNLDVVLEAGHVNEMIGQNKIATSPLTKNASATSHKGLLITDN